MDALWKEGLYTIEDIYALPEGVRAELIDGQIYYMASPSTNHQRLVHFFVRMIGNYIENNKGECEVFPAPFAVFLNKDNKNYVEPDISVVCDKDKLDDRGCHGAPDWIIEIASPTSKPMDYYKKLFKYRTACVREYWVVDIDKSLVTVYDFVNDDMKEYSFGEEIPVGIYEGFYIKVEL
ncbi:MAG: Uma2 family endonuclease [Lachnospiraceae bacterium]|nr:Uma2 family endonuclease [Lachnospiraceae bacterium]